MGDTIILTGPTRGLGLATAKALLKRSPTATLVLAGRNTAELDRLARRLKRWRPRATLVPLPLDLQSQTSIRTFAETFRELDLGQPTALVLSAASLKRPLSPAALSAMCVLRSARAPKGPRCWTSRKAKNLP